MRAALPWLLWAAGVLPAPQQYTLPSFPKGLQPLVQRARKDESDPLQLWLVWQLPAGPRATLWAVGDCCDGERCLRTLLFLQRQERFRRAGAFEGPLENAIGGDVEPPTLEIAGQRLSFSKGAYGAKAGAATVLDPQTHSLLAPAELDRLAAEDFVAGRDLNAAARWSAICHAGCDGATHLKLGHASLRAGLLPQAETALREALKLDATLDEARLDLGDALAAQGKIGEARAAYELASQAKSAELAEQARGRLGSLDTPKTSR